jgi:predicted phage terminase large subunit-like protein
MKWSTVYKRAYNDDGSLFFPEKLSHAFLEQQKRSQGSYIFSNQYLNEIIPTELQTFKKEWFRYYDSLPKRKNTYIFIDPALSEADTSDSTGIVVVHTDPAKRWFIEHAHRYRITPTKLIDYIFELNRRYRPQTIGIEEVAYQKALLYFLSEEMRRRGELVPATGIKYSPDKSKQTRILSLVPRFEWGHVLLNQGMADLELELLQFPRGSHDDLIDALASIEYIAGYPDEKEDVLKKPHSPSDPNWERWVIQEKLRGASHGQDDEY